MAGKPVNLKQAPRQKIVEINRVGSWGRVVYEHKLECGHVENRKRAATSSTLACAGCVLAARHEQQLAQLPDDLGAEFDLLDVLGSRLAMSERDAARIKASIVARFQVPAEAVDVVLDHDDEGVLSLSYAVVVLSADEIRRFVSDS